MKIEESSFRVNLYLSDEIVNLIRYNGKSVYHSCYCFIDGVKVIKNRKIANKMAGFIPKKGGCLENILLFCGINPAIFNQLVEAGLFHNPAVHFRIIVHLFQCNFFFFFPVIITGKEIKGAKCTKKSGEAPKQTVDFEEMAAGGGSLDLDENFYGDQDFDMEDFDAEGFDVNDGAAGGGSSYDEDKF